MISSIVTMVSAPIIKDGGTGSTFRRSYTSSTLYLAMSWTYSPCPSYLDLSSFSSYRDGTTSAFMRWWILFTLMFTLTVYSSGHRATVQVYRLRLQGAWKKNSSYDCLPSVSLCRAASGNRWPRSSYRLPGLE